jgi:hypothetical protein
LLGISKNNVLSEIKKLVVSGDFAFVGGLTSSKGYENIEDEL